MAMSEPENSERFVEVLQEIRDELRGLRLELGSRGAARMPSGMRTSRMNRRAVWRNPALAAAGVESLERVVEQAANAVPVTPHENDWPPKLPQPDSPWTERRQAVMGYVCWLVDGCGVTRAAAARVLNSSGQRTRDGLAWQSKNVSALLDGRYDREAAA